MTSGSKISFYVLGWDTDGQDSWIENNLLAAGQKYVKIDFAFERAKAALAKGMTVVYRDLVRWEDAFKEAHPYGQGDPVAAAGDWLNLVMPMLATVPQAHRARLFCNGAYNEPGDLENADKLSWYGAFELQRAKLLNSAGFGCAMFAFSAEARIHDKWLPLRAAMAYAIASQGKCVIDLHSYNSPTLFDPGVTGIDVNEFLLPFKPLAAELRKAGYNIPPKLFMLGEHGIDQITYPGTWDHPAKPFNGYKTVPDMRCATMVNEFQQADAVFMASPELMFAAIYIWCNADLDEHKPYNIRYPIQIRKGQWDDRVDWKTIEYIQTVPAQPDPPQPQPPNPQPGSGQYEITQPLNIRAGRGKATADIGDLARGSLITVSDVSGPDADGNTWAELRGYVAINLARKVEP